MSRSRLGQKVGNFALSQSKAYPGMTVGKSYLVDRGESRGVRRMEGAGPKHFALEADHLVPYPGSPLYGDHAAVAQPHATVTVRP